MKTGNKKTKLKRNVIVDNGNGTSTVIINSRKHGVAHIFISTEDAPTVARYCWALAATDPGRTYATTRVQKPDGKYTTMYMHVLIAQPGDGLVVDHINHNSLDNTRSNLRCVPHYVNIHNLRKKPKGYNRRPNGKYRAQLSVNGVAIIVGYYPTPEEAEAAYWAAKAAHGLVP